MRAGTGLAELCDSGGLPTRCTLGPLVTAPGRVADSDRAAQSAARSLDGQLRFGSLRPARPVSASVAVVTGAHGSLADVRRDPTLSGLPDRRAGSRSHGLTSLDGAVLHVYPLASRTEPAICERTCSAGYRADVEVSRSAR